MIATLIDTPVGYSTLSPPRRPDIVYNTPYQKSTEDSRTAYGFSQGFYHTSQTQIQHPVAELKKSEMFRLIQKFFNQSNDLLPQFQSFDQTTLAHVFVEILSVIVSNELQQPVFERTSDDSLMLKATYKEYRTYLEVDYDPDQPDRYEAVLNAYCNKKHVFFAAGDVQSVFSHFFMDVQSPALT